MNRRKFISKTTLASAGLFSLPISKSFINPKMNKEMFFKISLAEWSLNEKLFSGEINNLDFPSYTKEKFYIDAVEYVNQFFPSAGKKYTDELKKRCSDAGVKSLLIMIDGEGDLGELYYPKRMRAVERHYPWVEAAKNLGCHSIRVNARGNGSEGEVAKAAAEGLRKLSEFAMDFDINVLVENHGGYSSDAQWLTNVIKNTEMDNCGTLPDFGNFRISNSKEYDRYQGVKELMPYAKGVSAKSHDFNKKGQETHTDYEKMIKIVKDAGYTGYIGIEYEGSGLSEDEGIMATKSLLMEVGAKLS